MNQSASAASNRAKAAMTKPVQLTGVAAGVSSAASGLLSVGSSSSASFSSASESSVSSVSSASSTVVDSTLGVTVSDGLCDGVVVCGRCGTTTGVVTVSGIDCVPDWAPVTTRLCAPAGTFAGIVTNLVKVPSTE